MYLKSRHGKWQLQWQRKMENSLYVKSEILRPFLILRLNYIENVLKFFGKLKQLLLENLEDFNINKKWIRGASKVLRKFLIWSGKCNHKIILSRFALFCSFDLRYFCYCFSFYCCCCCCCCFCCLCFRLWWCYCQICAELDRSSRHNSKIGKKKE